MRKTHLIITALTIIILLTPLFGQGRHQPLKIEDFNGDGYIDTLKSYYSGGSGFGGWYAELINGKSNEVYKLDSWSSFSDIRNITTIPEVLRKSENLDFLNTILSSIFSQIKDYPDPSLKWIIDGLSTTSKLSNSNYFNQFFSPESIWLEKISMPSSYSLVYDNKIITYKGHNHYRNPTGDSLLVAANSNQYKILRTSHGLIANKEGKYKWIFITDSQLTGSPSKLRWESIGDVILKDQYVLLSQELRGSYKERNYFLIDIESGKVGRLKVQSKKDYDSLILNNWESIINEFYILK